MGPTVDRALVIEDETHQGSLGLFARNVTPARGDPDFDLFVCCGDVDGAPGPHAQAGGAPAQAPTRGEPGKPAVCKWRIDAPLPTLGVVEAGATASREGPGLRAQGATPLAGSALVACCADDDGDGAATSRRARRAARSTGRASRSPSPQPPRAKG